jgi:altronate hydrolase
MPGTQPARLIRLQPIDDVAIAATDIAAGSQVDAGDGPFAARDDIGRGHKIALRDLRPGVPVLRYGQVIGFAGRDIAAGEHVHLHNLEYREFQRDYEFAVDARIEELLDESERASFDGYLRSDGKVGTRNYLGVLTSVNCSATAAKQIAARMRYSGVLDDYEHVDGVVALTHGTGCGMTDHGEGWDLLRRTLAGYARHPNIGGLVVVGLGCEVNVVSSLMADLGVAAHVPVGSYTIQDVGGTAAAIAHGVDQVRGMIDQLAGTPRTEVGVEHLVLGLECGGSDGWSGLTANPALGVASDLLVAVGATTVLGETPEIYGAEHLLAARAVSTEVADALLARITWWENYTRSQGTTMDSNPSPGNKAGGITTILEKSLGAAAKAGNSPLSAVCEYAEAIPRPGLVFMDTPGYDPVSVTGMVAGGATLICFTTGRGSVFGSRPAPTVKLASNAQTARRMAGDIDVDCSPVVEEGLSMQAMGRRVYDVLLDVASGRPSASEALGLGGEEMVPWQLGAVL